MPQPEPARISTPETASQPPAIEHWSGKTQETIHDQQLIAQLIARNAEAWNYFLIQFQNLIHARIRASFGELGRSWDQGLAEESASQVLLVLLQDDCEALRRFEGRSRFSTWLSVIVRRVSLAVLLKRSESTLETDGGDDFDWNQVPQTLDPPDLADWLGCSVDTVRLGLQSLKAEDQSVLIWFYFDELSYREIADRLQLTENAIGPRLSRARERLKRFLIAQNPSSLTDVTDSHSTPGRRTQ